MGMNALMYACAMGNTPISTRLLSYAPVPVQLNLIDREKETALHKACHTKNVDVLRLLLNCSELQTILSNQVRCYLYFNPHYLDFA